MPFIMRAKAKDSYKHFTLVRPGQPVLLVEYCSDCHTHNNSLRHDADKYLQKALELKAAVQKEFPFFKIVLEPLDVSRKNARERLGLFEVTICTADAPQPRLLASKLKTLKWPEVRTVVNNVRGVFPGRTLSVAFQTPPGQPFHPVNQFEKSIQAVLVSEYDLPQFQDRLQQKSKRLASTTVSRTRTLSAIVQKKIQSGVLKETEIDELLSPKTFIAEQRCSGELRAEFSNVKPGAYKLVVMANRNFLQSSQDVFVTPQFRGKEEPLQVAVPLLPQKNAFFSLAVEFEPANPVFRICFQRKPSAGGQSEAEEELERCGESQTGSKHVAHFQIASLPPGRYLLECEFKDFQGVNSELEVFPGLNSFRLPYPSLQLVFAAPEEKPLKEETVTVARELSALKDQTHKTHSRDKENVANFARPDSAANERPNSRKTEPERAENDDRMPFQKQRGASGNRIRPGERLYSAKSKNNQQTVGEAGKSHLVVTAPVETFRGDPAYQLLEKHVVGDSLNIFLRSNPQFKLEFEFVIDRSESIEDQSQFYNERLVESDFEQHVLRHVQGFEFGRIFVERLSAKGTEKTELWVVNGTRATRIDLGEYFGQMAAEGENFCDVAIIVNDAERAHFEELVSLVPMAEPIKCFTGVLEIKSIASFVRHSKFGLEKFFGFEDEGEEAPPATLPRSEVVESLRNYEIEFSSPYVLNAVRIDKKGTVCLDKLRRVFGQWQRMADATEGLELEEDDDVVEEQDEDFETGGNAEDTADHRVDEDDEFRDEEFDD